MKNILKNIVGAVAPTLGTALGGPMAGMDGNMSAEVLGVPNYPKAIEKGIAAATPEQMLGTDENTFQLLHAQAQQTDQLCVCNYCKASPHIVPKSNQA